MLGIAFQVVGKDGIVCVWIWSGGRAGSGCVAAVSEGVDGLY